MADISTGTTSISYGSVLRIGYRANGSASAFTYINTYPTIDQLPYTFVVPLTGAVEIEYTEVCPNCSGNTYSDPQLVVINIT
jgi:hypothetical protein